MAWCELYPDLSLSVRWGNHGPSGSAGGGGDWWEPRGGDSVSTCHISPVYSTHPTENISERVKWVVIFMNKTVCAISLT